MILLGLGGNLPSHKGAPDVTLHAALSDLARKGADAVSISPFYRSRAWPHGDQPDYVNAVARLETAHLPMALLRLLQQIERDYGRSRAKNWGPRTLDLDLLDYEGLVLDEELLTLPHPWIEDRNFVLRPLMDVAPQWRHPVSGQSAGQLLAALGNGQDALTLWL